MMYIERSQQPHCWHASFFFFSERYHPIERITYTLHITVLKGIVQLFGKDNHPVLFIYQFLSVTLISCRYPFHMPINDIIQLTLSIPIWLPFIYFPH